jgi:hypothetical protein
MEIRILVVSFLYCCMPLCASETSKLEKSYSIQQRNRIERSKEVSRKRVDQIRIDLKLSSSKEVGQFFVDRLQLSSEQISNLIQVTRASRKTYDNYNCTVRRIQRILTREQMIMISELILEYPSLLSKKDSCLHDVSSTNATLITQ